jgi:hypothetical protein
MRENVTLVLSVSEKSKHPPLLNSKMTMVSSKKSKPRSVKLAIHPVKDVPDQRQPNVLVVPKDSNSKTIPASPVPDVFLVKSNSTLTTLLVLKTTEADVKPAKLVPTRTATDVPAPPPEPVRCARKVSSEPPQVLAVNVKRDVINVNPKTNA